ncbi:MAG: amino acid transporter [Bdellovibrionota bacterium]
MTDIGVLAALLAASGKPIWLAGGHAIDAYLRRSTRDHDDLDFAIRRADQLAFQRTLNGWDLCAADPPGSGTLVQWSAGQFYDLPIHNVWCRRHENSPWELELLFSEFEGDEWVYRRNRAIRGPITEFGWTHATMSVIAPEIQLLYKSRSRREKDLFDFQNCLKVFEPWRSTRLREWVTLDSGADHPWLPLF